MALAPDGNWSHKFHDAIMQRQVRTRHRDLDTKRHIDDGMDSIGWLLRFHANRLRRCGYVPAGEFMTSVGRKELLETE